MHIQSLPVNFECQLIKYIKHYVNCIHGTIRIAWLNCIVYCKWIWYFWWIDLIFMSVLWSFTTVINPFCNKSDTCHRSKMFSFQEGHSIFLCNEIILHVFFLLFHSAWLKWTMHFCGLVASALDCNVSEIYVSVTYCRDTPKTSRWVSSDRMRGSINCDCHFSFLKELIFFNKIDLCSIKNNRKTLC